MKNKKFVVMTYGKVMDEVLKLKTPKDGERYTKRRVMDLRRHRAEWRRMSYVKAKAIWLSNLGYFVGYYSRNTAKKFFRIMKNSSHPIFGRY